MLGLIWAQGRDQAIGTQGKLPWHLPEDLAFFKSVTSGNPVIMGRATWDSLPPRFRPLPGRQNIVLTHSPCWEASGAERAASLKEAINMARGNEVWVIGGASVYEAALPFADTLVVTSVDIRVDDADAFAPSIGEEWQAVWSDPPMCPKETEHNSLPIESEWKKSSTGLFYRFTRYERRPN